MTLNRQSAQASRRRQSAAATTAETNYYHEQHLRNIQRAAASGRIRRFIVEERVSSNNANTRGGRNTGNSSSSREEYLPRRASTALRNNTQGSLATREASQADSRRASLTSSTRTYATLRCPSTSTSSRYGYASMNVRARQRNNILRLDSNIESNGGAGQLASEGSSGMDDSTNRRRTPAAVVSRGLSGSGTTQGTHGESARHTFVGSRQRRVLQPYNRSSGGSSDSPSRGSSVGERTSTTTTSFYPSAVHTTNIWMPGTDIEEAFQRRNSAATASTTATETTTTTTTNPSSEPRMTPTETAMSPHNLDVNVFLLEDLHTALALSASLVDVNEQGNERGGGTRRQLPRYSDSQLDELSSSSNALLMLTDSLAAALASHGHQQSDGGHDSAQSPVIGGRQFGQLSMRYEDLVELEDVRVTASESDIRSLNIECVTQSHRCYGSSCTVCLCDFSVGDSVVVLPRCGHAYHYSCISRWLLEYRDTCPSCRSKVFAD